MLNKLSVIEKLSSSLNKINQKDFNASLPIVIKVIAKTKGFHYLLEVGSVKIETKSQKELQIGQKYWANMSKSSVGAIMLSDLKKRPLILEKIQNFPLKFYFEDLKDIFKDKNQEYKDFLLEKFVNSQNKDEFLNLGNLLLSLQKGVGTFIVNENGKNILIQTKKKDINRLDFYAIYPNLGEIEGYIFFKNENLKTQIFVGYESIKKILENNLKTLKQFDEIEIILKKNITPFFEFQEKLLNIKA